MVDTTFKHIGNVLANATEEELHIVLNQYLTKTEMSKDKMLNLFSEVIDCRLFYFDGSMRKDTESEEYTQERKHI